MGNMELIELRQTSATIQCPSCLKHVPERLNMCQCGVWLRPHQSTMDRTRTACAALKTPYYRASIIFSRGMKSGHKPWQMDHQKDMDAKRGVLKRGQYSSFLDRLQKYEVYRALNWYTVGLKSGSSTSTTSQRLTSVMTHLADRDYDMKAQSIWEASNPINKQDHCVNDLIIIDQKILLSAFNELKAKEYLIFHCTCGQDRITHWIPPTTFRMVEFQLEDVFSRHLHPWHGQEAQRGGVLHLWTINGKNGTLKGGKTKNGGISDNNNNARGTRRLVQGDLYGEVRAKWSQLLSSSPESGLHLQSCALLRFFVPSGSYASSGNCHERDGEVYR